MVGAKAESFVFGNGSAMLVSAEVTNISNIGYDEMVFIGITLDRSTGDLRIVFGADGSTTTATASSPIADPNPDLSSYRIVEQRRRCTTKYRSTV